MSLNYTGTIDFSDGGRHHHPSVETGLMTLVCIGQLPGDSEARRATAVIHVASHSTWMSFPSRREVEPAHYILVKCRVAEPRTRKITFDPMHDVLMRWPARLPKKS